MTKRKDTPLPPYQIMLVIEHRTIDVACDTDHGTYWLRYHHGEPIGLGIMAIEKWHSQGDLSSLAAKDMASIFGEGCVELMLQNAK